jgi:hypothetical protein
MSLESSQLALKMQALAAAFYSAKQAVQRAEKLGDQVDDLLGDEVNLPISASNRQVVAATVAQQAGPIVEKAATLAEECLALAEQVLD